MISTKAYAKINLGLRILRRRDDGYHDIETVFHRVNIFDEIALSPSSGISLACNAGDLPFGEENLCVRAASMLQEKCNISDGVQIQLQKNIPIGAGLGGGSSDAAATLVGLNQLWNLRLGNDQLNHFALLLGSDVPYFLSPGSAYATGRGELLEYFPLDLPYWIVIVYPNLHISTTWAYQQLDLRNGDSKGKARSTESSIKEILTELIQHPRRLITSLMNDFEPTILAAHPEIGQIKKKLYDLGAEFAQLSGSGSSVYGLFIQEEEATHAIGKLKNGYQTFITPPSFTPEIPVATH